MPAPLQFHFDFISPYGYFASRRIDAIAQRHGRTVEWHAMLLGVSVLKVMGLKPLMQTPLKGDYLRRDIPRHARRMGLTLGRSLEGGGSHPLAMARAFQWIKHHQPALQGAAAHTIYEAYWAEGRDLSGPASLTTLNWPEGLDGAAIAAAAASEEAATLLREAVAASIAQGVFGSPTVIVDGEPFWGFDRLGDVEAWLAEGGW
ncbi:2-hydroxychromene-2-carboxylate isomerase [Ramlibacter sp.]|uniref:2-hydroxychromene-2-carboxylate isomerase n=1 Tax=Ramlibacter sp. TaxID=1917967 RepID=UPI0035AE886A